jgi:hypothetical protein
MADDVQVGLKCEVKKIFDKDMTKAVLKQIGETIESAVNKTKGLAFDAKTKEGWLLIGTVVSLDIDDPDSPTSLTIKITIDGMKFGGSSSLFKANGGGTQKGVRPKKLEDDVKGLVDDVFKDLMNDKVIPAIQSN